MIIQYNTSVFTPAGWRNEAVTARVEPITAARARVIEVLDVGAVKLISKATIVENENEVQD
jgi:hypothetical protein